MAKRKGKLLIKTYGEFWRRDLVYWNKSELLGWNKNRSRVVNFWKMKTVYALFYNYELVYIGQTFNQSLGNRLKQHLKDEFKGRWDTFSWYGVQDIASRPGNKLQLGSLNRNEHPTTKEIVLSMEAIAIRIADPPLNRKRPKFGSSRKPATHFHQVDWIKSKQQATLFELKRSLEWQRKKIEKIWNKAKRIN